MTIKQLIQHLKQFDQEIEVIIGSDEELNNIYSNLETSIIEIDDLMDTSEKVIIYPIGRPQEQ